MLDLTNILSLEYFFNMNPGKILPIYFNTITPVFVVFIIIGIIFKKLAKKQKLGPDKKLMAKLSSFFKWMGVFALLYIFFREKYIYFLSAPFWMIVWIAVFIVWGYKILDYNYKKRPVLIKKIKEKQEKEKYFNKQKKK